VRSVPKLAGLRLNEVNRSVRTTSGARGSDPAQAAVADLPPGSATATVEEFHRLTRSLASRRRPRGCRPADPRYGRRVGVPGSLLPPIHPRLRTGIEAKVSLPYVLAASFTDRAVTPGFVYRRCNTPAGEQEQRPGDWPVRWAHRDAGRQIRFVPAGEGRARDPGVLAAAPRHARRARALIRCQPHTAR
jgi:hypothetical protein